MLHEFLTAHRAELAARCRSKVATRSSPAPTASELNFGVPILIDQLVSMLCDEQVGTRIAEPSVLPLVIGQSAMKHGAELMRRGFTVDQVVHDYGDLCQALTELASEKHEAISVDEFHTFNRCLDSAIAEAVGEFGRQRDHVISAEGAQSLNERLGWLAHEQRNLLNTAQLAFTAIQSGHGAATGATGAMLRRSLQGLQDLIDRALAEVRLSSGLHAAISPLSLDSVLEETRIGAELDATSRGLSFSTSVTPGLSVTADHQMLSSAIANLLQNAFKFTRSGGHVSLGVHPSLGRVLIEVADECGGLPPGRRRSLSPIRAARSRPIGSRPGPFNQPQKCGSVRGNVERARSTGSRLCVRDRSAARPRTVTRSERGGSAPWRRPRRGASACPRCFDHPDGRHPAKKTTEQLRYRMGRRARPFGVIENGRVHFPFSPTPSGVDSSSVTPA